MFSRSMFSQVFVLALLLASISAQDTHGLGSYATNNAHYNSVQRIAIAPAITKYVASSSAIDKVPVQAKLAIPVVASYAAPSASSYFNAPGPIYAAPVNKFALPVVAAPLGYAPSASAHFSAQTPVYAAPVNKVALPVVAAPAEHAASAAHHQEEFAHPKYEYAYAIEDHHTGDLHSQQEQRDGDHVVGQYTLHEADGTIRIVKYFDEGHGFNVVIEKQGTPTEAPAEHKKVAVPVAVAVPNH